jgi:hypothetical protein
LAALTGVTVSVLANGPLSDPISIALGASVGLSTLGATAAGFWYAVRNNYRRWRQRSANEVNAVLDRLEKGDELRPPPAPWVRKLQLKFGRL